MDKIEPKQHLDNAHIVDYRSAIEHRATWMYLLFNEAIRRGLSPEFARKAVYDCGCFHKSLKPQTNDLKEYCDSVFTELGVKAFEQEIEISDEEYKVTFNYCPLVSAWQKQTDDQELIELLCDIAMDGDRGLFSSPEFEFHLDQTIAKGCDSCIVRVTRRKDGNDGEEG